MRTMSRREFLGRTGGLIVAGAIPVACGPVSALAKEDETQPKPSDAESEAIAEIVRQFMDNYHVPGMSVAIARHGQAVLQQGCLLYTSPSPRDGLLSRMPSSA